MEIDNVMAEILSFESAEEKWVLIWENPRTYLTNQALFL